MDYYSPLWGLGAIFIVAEPQCALLCHSSTPAVLADSGPIHVLLLTFWPILARFMEYYSPFWDPRAISTINDPRGAFTCRSSTLAVLVILARFVDYYSPF